MSILEGTLRDEIGAAVSGALVSLAANRGNSRFRYFQRMTGSAGEFRFTDVPKGPVRLIVSNHGAGFMLGANGGATRIDASFPIDVQRHAFIGSVREDAEMVFDLPATKPGTGLSLSLELGCRVTLDCAPPPEVEWVIFAPLFWRDQLAFGAPDPAATGPNSFHGLRASKNAVQFEGRARIRRSATKPPVELRWTLPRIAIKPGESRHASVLVPAPAKTSGVHGRIQMGKVPYALKNRARLQAAGYHVGADPEMAAEAFNCAVRVSLWSRAGDYILDTMPDSTGQFSFPRVPPGRYSFQAIYYRLAARPDYLTGVVVPDPYDGHYKPDPIELIIGNKAKRIEVLFPTEMAAAAKRLKEGRFSKDVSMFVR